MSSDQNSSVENLELSGRGHRKEKPIVRRIRQEHGTLIVSIPKRIGLKLNDEVIIDQIGKNPLSWEIRFKLNRAEEK